MNEKSNIAAEQEAQQYSRGWYEMMVRIWRDRLSRMVPPDTGNLYRSVQPAGLHVSGLSMQAMFKFVQYGIYVDAGVGNGYKKGNGGYLEILDKTYRRTHNLKKQRKRRPWFSRSWAISCKVIGDTYSRLAGDNYVGMMAEIEK